MKLKVLAILLLATAASAQTAHYADLAWSAASGATGYNVYRAPCNGTITNQVCSSEGAFTKLASLTTFSYRDTGVTGGGKYVYYVTATAPGFLESNPSNRIAVAIPMDQLPSPILGTVTVAMSTRGSNQDVLAQWDASAPTSYALTDGANSVLAQGSKPAGNQSVSITTKKHPTPFTVTVCSSTECKSATT